MEKKLSCHCYTKDKVLTYLKSHIVYEFCCPVCNIKYIGDQEHSGSGKKLPVYNHLLDCEPFNYVVNLHSLLPSNNSVEYLEHVKIAVCDNTKINDNSQNELNFAF